MEFTVPLTHGKKGRHAPGPSKGFLEYEIAALPEVQAAIDHVAFTIFVRAEENLKAHQSTQAARAAIELAKDPSFPVDELLAGHAHIELEHEDIDRLISLNDELGQRAALAIEQGHRAYTVTRSDGTTYEVGASEGTFILHDAANLPHSGAKGISVKGKVKRK